MATQNLDAAAIQAKRVEDEAKNWQIPTLDQLETPIDGELPIIDLSVLKNDSSNGVNIIASQLSTIFKSTGFFLLINHGCEDIVEEVYNSSV